MKNILAVLFICVGASFAQDSGGERVNVPLTDPARPARIHCQLMMGGITVRGANTREVVVEVRPQQSGHTGHERPLPPKAEGMHRIDIGGMSGLDVVEQDNLVTIKTTSWTRHGDLVITVPRHSSLQLKAMNDGLIDVEQLDGEIDADTLNGRIELKNVSGAVLAHCLNGEIVATLDQVDPTKPMAFSTLNGDIDVTLPDNVRANIRMKTDNGEMYSDFDIKLDAGSHAIASEPGKRENGSYRIRLDKTVHGTINGGGPEIQFTSLNGQIYIRKRK
jgi:hypothetical protein